MTEALLAHRPDVVMVQGDTTTAFTASLAAFYQQIPVAHVEAGLRTRDPHSPFPEEINRALIARLARWHFTPTDQATQNLLREGIASEAITQCGNTVIDAVELIKSKWATHPFSGPASTWFVGRDLVLVTTHRRENFGQGLQNICGALEELCAAYPQLGFVFPVHLNPQVQSVVHTKLAGIPNLLMTEPVDFETSLYLQSRSVLILTDSGGIQEEAPSFSVPAVVMRQHTERREGVDAGFATLAGTDKPIIIRAARSWLNNPDRREALLQRTNPYGDGKASERVLKVLLSDFATATHDPD
jgi:UDP-N-acetylglucosamine 2-epimerase (non-hydrolysing)